jgi:hypothetical protein
MWMGGFVPLGYDVRDRKLVVNQAEAKVVRMIFERFASLGSATIVARVLRAENIRNKRGKHIDKGVIYRLINNRVYLGEAVYKGVSYPGEHEAIVSQQLWDAAHAVLKESPRARALKTRDRSPALLKGIIFSSSGAAMTPTFTRKGDRLYRYYVSMDHVRGRPVPEGLAPTRLPAAMVEATVVAEMRRMIATPEMAARILDQFQQENVPCDQRELLAELRRFNKLWDVLFPAERARIVRLLVARVTVDAEGLQIDLRHEGLGTLARDLLAGNANGAAA